MTSGRAKKLEGERVQPLLKEAGRDMSQGQESQERKKAKESIPIPPPEFLSGKHSLAKRTSFKRFVRLISDTGITCIEADSVLIARMVKLHFRMLKCERFIEDYGISFEQVTTKQTGDIVLMRKKYHEVGVLQTDEKEFRQLCDRYGLNPLARQNMNTESGKEDDSIYK